MIPNNLAGEDRGSTERHGQRFASVPRRIASFGIDYLAILLYISLVVLVVTGTGVAAGERWVRAWSDPVIGQLLGLLALTLPVVLYFAAFEASRFGGTPGKRMLGVRVESAAGASLSPGRALLRSAAKFLPWELAHGALRRIPGWPAEVTVVPAGALLILAVTWLLVAAYLLVPLRSGRRQTPYDWLAGAVVVVAARRNGAAET